MRSCAAGGRSDVRAGRVILRLMVMRSCRAGARHPVRLALAAGLVLVAACTHSPGAPQSTAPAPSTASGGIPAFSWQRVSPARVGLDAAALNRIAPVARRGKSKCLAVVRRDGSPLDAAERRLRLSVVVEPRRRDLDGPARRGQPRRGRHAATPRPARAACPGEHVLGPGAGQPADPGRSGLRNRGRPAGRPGDPAHTADLRPGRGESRRHPGPARLSGRQLPESGRSGRGRGRFAVGRAGAVIWTTAHRKVGQSVGARDPARRRLEEWIPRCTPSSRPAASSTRSPRAM
jgi:hypothetical protein